MEVTSKIEAARELLTSTRRSLQIVDEHIALLSAGRSAVDPAADSSSEHRASWLGAVDDTDALDGILLGPQASASSYSFQNVKTGTIRNQEDAAFVCTNILVALAWRRDSETGLFTFVLESENATGEPGAVCLLRLTDGSSGRSLITGATEAPLDRDRGAVPFSYLSSFRHGLGSNTKNKLFSEFTIPRAGVVRAEVFNLGQFAGGSNRIFRACVTLLGYKVYG